MIVALCEPSEGVYSETFIRAHAEQLPQPVLHLSGGHPLWSLRGKRIIPKAYRAAEFAGKRLQGWTLAAARRASLRQLAGFFRQERIDVVLAEYGTTAVDVLEACQQAGVPLVAHFHGADAYQQETLRQQRDAYPRLFQEAAAIVGVSRAMEKQLLDLGAPRERLFYNPCGVDLNAFPPANPAQNEPIFIGIGRFVDKKAPYLALLAFAEALREAPGARLVLVGDGPLWTICRSLIDALGLASSVTLTGRQTPAEVAAWMGRARAFVQHSITPPAGESAGDREGTPVAVMEAGSCALPVIGTRHGGIPDVIDDGVSGLLCAECDIHTMGAHIAALAKDPERARTMGLAARQRVVAGFSKEHTIGRLAQILAAAATGKVLALHQSGELA